MSGPITTTEVQEVILKQIAARALDRIKANTVMTRLVNRNYEPAFASAGDTITIGLPSNFNVINLPDGSSVTKQNPTTQKTTLVLNNHLHVSFQITDMAEIFTPVNVRTSNMGQALANLAESIDASIISAAYAGFTANAPVGAYNTALTEATVLNARKSLVKAKIPKLDEKFLVVHPDSYTDLLKTNRLTEYQTRGRFSAMGGSNAFGQDGDGADGSPIANGALGTIAGFQVFEDQVVPVTNSNEIHNIAFSRDAILFASRKLPSAPPGLGVIQVYVEEDGMAIRVTMNYNGDILGSQITIDTLFGVGIGRNQFGVEVRA
jgi:hypothetical protein